MMTAQLDEQKRSQRVHLRAAACAVSVFISLLCLLACFYMSYRSRQDELRVWQVKFDELQCRAKENQAYLHAGNGIKCALVKLLKPNLPHKSV